MADTFDILQCDRCGYDLRATDPDGICPECGYAVADSIEAAKLPHRPAWRDSDPRWRRRMLAGCWVLVLLPLVDLLNDSGLAAKIATPAFFEYGFHTRPLSESLFYFNNTPFFVAIGLAFLFYRENGRKWLPLDWTRRTGVLCVLVFAYVAFGDWVAIPALVGLSVTSTFQSLPLDLQPPITPFLGDSGYYVTKLFVWDYNIGIAVVIVLAGLTMLLAAHRLSIALRAAASSRLVAALILSPIALSAVLNIAMAWPVWKDVHSPFGTTAYEIVKKVPWSPMGFSPDLISEAVLSLRTPSLLLSPGMFTLMELLKWGSLLVITTWLTTAQIRSYLDPKGPAVNTTSPQV
ncbi:MAG: hypothetical protein AAF561_05415 [Planctomycetota bacterium]